MSSVSNVVKPTKSNGAFGDHLVRPEQFGLPNVASEQTLTPLDMNMPRLYATRWILFFELPLNVDKEKLYKDLQVGLAYTILEIPWLGGSVQPESELQPQSNRIKVAKEPGGVNFKYNDLTKSSATFPTYAQLRDAQFPLSKLSTSTLSPLDVVPQGPQPVMAAQANFIKGGLLLTVAAHHSVCDGTGLNAVLDLWAQNTCAASTASTSVSIDPLIQDRSPLMIGKAGVKRSDFPEYFLAPTPPAAISDLNSHQMASTPFQLPAMTSKIFYVTPSSLEELKSAARAHSTHDALQAFLWNHITLARNPSEKASPSPDEEKTPAILFATNIRARLSPPLPPNYLGNASMAGITRRVPVASMSTSPSSLISAASDIRTAVEVFNNKDRIPRTIGLISSRTDPTDNKFAYNGFLGPDLSSTSWADFGVYDMEWGRLGKPEAFRTPGEGADGTIVILPKLKRGGLEVIVGLEDAAMDRLMEDKPFVAFATPWA